MESINSPDLQVGVKIIRLNKSFSQKKSFFIWAKAIYSVSIFHDLKVVAMRVRILLLVFFFYSVSSPLLHAQRLGRFTMSKFAAGGQSGIAYPMQKSFFGKLPSDTIPSYILNDTTYFFIYLWLPKPVKELGLQLISPVPQFASAWKGDYEAEDYHDSLKTSGKYFDPVLIVERMLGIGSPEEALSRGTGFMVNMAFGRNDNSSEAPAQPSMKKNNSLLRIGASEKDTAYAPAGVYIIFLSSAGNKKPEGTFVLQVGVTEIVPGLKLFRRKDELSESY
jgi:hypothetical protein